MLHSIVFINYFQSLNNSFNSYFTREVRADDGDKQLSSNDVFYSITKSIIKKFICYRRNKKIQFSISNQNFVTVFHLGLFTLVILPFKTIMLK